ncbi:MAG: hypothetical protein MMC33_006342 [Icmadophila ericetorum]|nr:hypothetical protein [Icmadophila ericetorum]
MSSHLNCFLPRTNHYGTDKGQRYIHLLDVARCNKEWQAIPDLARKVGKYAPQRKCLIAAAQVDYEIASQASESHRPSSAKTNRLQHLINTLRTTIENETESHDDIFQAKSLLSWHHWADGEHDVAYASLPPNLPHTSSEESEKHGPMSGWSYICVFRCVYIRGAFLEKNGKSLEALTAYEAGLPYVSKVLSLSSHYALQDFWIELYLKLFCLLASRQFHSDSDQNNEFSDSLQRGLLLAPFRTWLNYWEHRRTSLAGHSDAEASHWGRYTWGSYYNTLSIILQQGLPYPTTSQFSGAAKVVPNNIPDGQAIQVQTEQYKELRLVEVTYESLLLKGISFPQANQSNTEIENWVSQVMANWYVIAGLGWRAFSTSQDDQEAVGRNVLDILYRAATRTFHSTAILRHLFTVHASLAEFTLAEKAFDSYLELVTKGKESFAKSGEVKIGLDDNEKIIRTAASGIQMLCTFGRREEAEKAYKIASTLSKWLEEPISEGAISSQLNGMNLEEEAIRHKQSSNVSVSGPCRAAGYRSVGISQAHLARLTFEPSRREELQKSAIANIRKALDPALGDQRNVETLFVLALMLAETRDLEGGLLNVKATLSSQYKANSAANKAPSLDKEGPMVKVWHLMALISSSKQEFDKAQKLCEAAIEAVLNSDLSTSLSGLGFLEKRSIIQIKMTQLVLSEVNEGAESAVNASGDLLGLFVLLFNYPEAFSGQKQVPAIQKPPTTAHSMMGSIKGTLLGLSKEGRSSVRLENVEGSALSQRQSAEVTLAPSATSFTENQSLKPPPSRHEAHSLVRGNSRKLQKRNSKKSFGSVRRSRIASPARSVETYEHEKATGRPSTATENGKNFAGDEVGVAVSDYVPLQTISVTTSGTGPIPRTQQLPSLAHNYDPAAYPPPVGYAGQSPYQDLRLPTTSIHIPPTPPEPHFAQLEAQRQAISLLLEVWVLIAGLYRRAKLYDDAQGALDEAFKQVRNIEKSVSQRNSSAQAFEQQCWGGVKSVEELWADVYTEKGNLCLARSEPHDAMLQYESAVSHLPDHPVATVGLANLLLDIYTEVIPPRPNSSTPSYSHVSASQSPEVAGTEPTLASLPSNPSKVPTTTTSIKIQRLNNDSQNQSSLNSTDSSTQSPKDTDMDTPFTLSRLAARDRAYGLLSSLTKLGTVWDNSEAWFALARAYEESGQVYKAKDCLWKVVELEEGRPVRNWKVLGWGGTL